MEYQDIAEEFQKLGYVLFLFLFYNSISYILPSPEFLICQEIKLGKIINPLCLMVILSSNLEIQEIQLSIPMKD